MNINNILENNIKILDLLNKVVTYLRVQNYYRAYNYYNDVIVIIENVVNELSKSEDIIKSFEIKEINQILTELFEAQQNEDNIFIADLLELKLIPYFITLHNFIENNFYITNQEIYINNMKFLIESDKSLFDLLEKTSIDSFDSTCYSIEDTSCGSKTLALYESNKKYYVHTNGNIYKEAEMLSKSWFSDEISNYIVYGLGLGYHIIELMDLDESIKITVYESDIKIIKLAFMYTNLDKLIKSNRVRIVYDPNLGFINREIMGLTEDGKFVIHYPSLRNIKSNQIKELFENYFITYSSINNQLHSLNNNFKNNIHHFDFYIDRLREKFANKNLYIVAAGPSLDKNFFLLNDLGSDSIILSTGTVYKKLINAGIKPDYVIITDANNSVYKQIEGIENSDIPLICLSTAYSKVLENYKGIKYLVCQEGFHKSEEYATKMGYSLFQTGGSVSTTALDIGIEFECNKVIFIGLDLAYTNNYDHAKDTACVEKIDMEGLRQIEDINGNKIYTSKNLDIYRKWIERRIQDVSGIEFIDATEGGAKINGMNIKTLSECIKV